MGDLSDHPRTLQIASLSKAKRSVTAGRFAICILCLL